MKPLPWVSPSKTRNFLLKDPILDYLDTWYHTLAFPNELRSPGIPLKIKSTENYNRRNSYDTFSSALMEMGNKFESEIVTQIMSKFKNDFIEIKNDQNFSNYDEKMSQLAELTIAEIRKGTPLIYQGVLIDNVEKIRGIPDLIVRNDFMNKLFTNAECPTLAEPLSYSIVDIKCSTLHMRSDGIHLLNSDSMPAYKGQLYLYSNLLGKILGKEPDIAYVLGKSWEYESKNVNYVGKSPFDKPGTIDYSSFDFEYKKLAFDAVNWIRDVKLSGDQWQFFPHPTRSELYPNMSYLTDAPWTSVKKIIAKKLNEITMIWNCGPNQRNIAHNSNILGWDNVKLTAEILGFKNKRADIVNNILTINRDTDNTVIPFKIKNDQGEWQSCPNKYCELFFDFETTQDNSKSILFMIGSITNTYEYKNFTADKLSDMEEKLLILNFYKYILDIETQHGKPVRLFHWSGAEKYILTSISKKFRNDIDLCNAVNAINTRLFDLKNIFMDEPIGIKNCFGYGLKEISKELYAQKLIITTWPENSTCMDGYSAMLLAQNLYTIKTTNSNEFIKGMLDIIKYNEIDCKVMSDILEFLRNRPDINKARPVDQTDDEEIIRPIKRRKIETINVDNEVPEPPQKLRRSARILNNQSSIKTYDHFNCDDDSNDMVDYELLNSIRKKLERITNQDEYLMEIVEIMSKTEKTKYSKSLDEIKNVLQNNDINIGQIFEAKCSIENKVKALGIFVEMTNESKMSIGYINSRFTIRELLYGVQTFKRFEKCHKNKNCNLAEMTDTIRHLNETMRVSLATIFSADLSEFALCRAVNLYDIRNTIDPDTAEYLAAEDALKNFITNPNNKKSAMPQNISIADQIDALPTISEIKTVVHNWNETVKNLDNSLEKNTIQQKIKFVLRLNHALYNPQTRQISDSRDVREKYSTLYEYKTRIDSQLYGMAKVKTQLIQLMADKLNNPFVERQVLGIAGPPGIGKTAICKAHAFAAKIPIYFCNVGSATDVTFFKGSNGVWSGADIGMVAKAMMQIVSATETENHKRGVIIFDEIDKINMTDPRARNVYNTMLEIFDPSQNNKFQDEFLPEIYIDLSKTTFMCTMNDETQIDPILLDRLKIIHCDSYSILEKINITKTHFLPKLAANAGFTNEIIISDATIQVAIEGTAKIHSSKNIEPGVRFLEQIIKSAVSWLNLCKLATHNFSGTEQPFDELIGDEYKNFPRIEIYDNSPVTVPVELINAIIKNLSTIDKSNKHFIQHLYL